MMLTECLDNERTLLVHRDDGSTLHKVQVQGQEVIVLLDQTGTQIKTAYPPDADVMKPWLTSTPKVYGEWE